MTSVGLAQIAIFALLLAIISKPLGEYMAKVMESEKTIFDWSLKPLERLIYRIMGVDPDPEMHWSQYAQALLIFSMVSTIFTYAVIRLQGILPLNPMHFSTPMAPEYATSMTPDLALNTAVSFATNTDWQSYGGESTMSYLSQMLGLAFQNWVSAAVGMAAAIALIRSFARHSAGTIGNFWRDLVRSLLYVLLPICFVFALILTWQGTVQNFLPYTTVKTVEGRQQIIPQGPVASQESIKLVGTNGGGLFNANSAHPFENPTPITNLLEMLSIFLIPAALTYTLGVMVKDVRQGRSLRVVMYTLFILAALICYHFECQGNPILAAKGVDTSTARLGDLGGNMEGKEVRFGLASSALFTTVTTDASCGAVNCSHDSLTPIGGLIPMLNIQLGEIVFGGVGSGLYGMLVYAVLAVFIAGLMVGRTPEYLGKKIGQKEVKLSMLFVLAGSFSILLFSALASVLCLPAGSSINSPGATYNNVGNAGAHGFSEILYAFSSGTGNNGSAFAGLNANTPFYNLALGLAMFIGRFGMMVPVLALAGSLVQKKLATPSSGTFPTHTALFVVLLISTIVIVGALTFLPALTLGPIVEHYLMLAGRLFK